MARLLVKKTPWWVAHKGQMLFWLPMATLQAGTLTGLAYAWDRLGDLERQATKQRADDVVGVGLVNRYAIPTDGVMTTFPVPVTLATSVRSGTNTPTTSVPLTLATIQTDQVRSLPSVALRSVTAQPKAAVVASRTMHSTKSFNRKGSKVRGDVPALPSESRRKLPKPAARAERAAAQAATTAVTPKQQQVLWETAKTAQANRDYSRIALSSDAPITVQPATSKGKASAVPVGGRVWVYLGQLRDYGWYGQKLHISPSSGLPEVGRAYLTQQIHGYYDAPHGKRYMGGFQQGDKVTILQVVREENGDVWAKILKEASVGRLD